MAAEPGAGVVWGLASPTAGAGQGGCRDICAAVRLCIACGPGRCVIRSRWCVYGYRHGGTGCPMRSCMPLWGHAWKLLHDDHCSKPILRWLCLVSRGPAKGAWSAPDRRGLRTGVAESGGKRVLPRQCYLSSLTLKEKLSCWLFTGPAAWSFGTFTRTLCPSPPSLTGGHARRESASRLPEPKGDMSKSRPHLCHRSVNAKLNYNLSLFLLEACTACCRGPRPHEDLHGCLHHASLFLEKAVLVQ